MFLHLQGFGLFVEVVDLHFAATSQLVEQAIRLFVQHEPDQVGPFHFGEACDRVVDLLYPRAVQRFVRALLQFGKPVLKTAVLLHAVAEPRELVLEALGAVLLEIVQFLVDLFQSLGLFVESGHEGREGGLEIGAAVGIEFGLEVLESGHGFVQRRVHLREPPGQSANLFAEPVDALLVLAEGALFSFGRIQPEISQRGGVFLGGQQRLAQRLPVFLLLVEDRIADRLVEELQVPADVDLAVFFVLVDGGHGAGGVDDHGNLPANADPAELGPYRLQEHQHQHRQHQDAQRGQDLVPGFGQVVLPVQPDRDRDGAGEQQDHHDRRHQSREEQF